LLKFLADENFNRIVISGALRIQPLLDIVHAQDVGLRQRPDAEILEWAAAQRRLVLTHDVSTMTKWAYRRMVEGKNCPEVLEIASLLSVPRAIEEILIVAECSREGEWEGQVLYLPL
jgi:predicted nuclease of predicted toxin-antitoxin system